MSESGKLTYLHKVLEQSVKDGKSFTHEESVVHGPRGLTIKYYSKKDDDVERIEIAQESIKLKGLRQEYDNLSKEIRDTMKEKQRLFEQLKATRSQRVQKIDGKQTFNLWMQKLMNDYGLKKKMGLEMEKMRLASEAEKKRWAALHTYANLEVDRPFLNADTVQEGD